MKFRAPISEYYQYKAKARGFEKKSNDDAQKNPYRNNKATEKVEKK